MGDPGDDVVRIPVASQRVVGIFWKRPHEGKGGIEGGSGGTEVTLSTMT